MKQIAITGASGFLGSYLVRGLAERQDHSLLGLTRRLPMVGETASVRWMHGDLGSIDDCRRFVESADVILHLAHASTPLTSDRNLPTDVQLSLIPTLNLLQAVREAGTRPSVIYASSGGAIYGQQSRRRPVNEATPCRPSSSYGIVKLAVEHYLRNAADQGWLRSTALRIGNPYGALLPTERTQGFIGVALNRIIHGESVRVFGDPDNVRDYVHLQDVAWFVDRVLDSKRDFVIYNVGSGQGRSVLEIIDLLSEFTGLAVQTEFVPASTAGSFPPWIVLDVAKARVELNWTPSIDFRAGLQVLCHEAQCTLLA